MILWDKRDEFAFKVAQRDIPGIDASYLAMDTEEGVEVVWNEVLFSERKISDSQHVCFQSSLKFFLDVQSFRIKLVKSSIN